MPLYTLLQLIWPPTALQLVSDEGRRQLRSAASSKCVVRRTYTNYGDRCFAAAGPKLWNSLPTELRQADISFQRFKRLLKIFLFGFWDRGALWLTVKAAPHKFSHLLPSLLTMVWLIRRRGSPRQSSIVKLWVTAWLDGGLDLSVEGTLGWKSTLSNVAVRRQMKSSQRHGVDSEADGELLSFDVADSIITHTTVFSSSLHAAAVSTHRLLPSSTAANGGKLKRSDEQRTTTIRRAIRLCDYFGRWLIRIAHAIVVTRNSYFHKVKLLNQVMELVNLHCRLFYLTISQCWVKYWLKVF